MIVFINISYSNSGCVDHMYRYHCGSVYKYTINLIMNNERKTIS